LSSLLGGKGGGGIKNMIGEILKMFGIGGGSEKAGNSSSGNSAAPSGGSTSAPTSAAKTSTRGRTRATQNVGNEGVSSNNESTAGGKQIFFGDSLAAGMGGSKFATVGATIQKMYGSKWKSALAMAKRTKSEICISVGTNNWGNASSIMPYMNRMVAEAKAAGVQIAISTLPPVRGNNVFQNVNNKIRQLGGQSHVRVVDMAKNYNSMGGLAGDGVHPRNFNKYRSAFQKQK